MAGLSDEAYWEESKTISYFGEIFGDEKSGRDVDKIENQIKNAYKSYVSLNINTNTPTEVLIPICDLLSDKARKKYLEDNRKKFIQHEPGISTIEETVNNIILDRSYDFKNYRSLSSKINLLDYAIKVADGNCLLTILLFIAKAIKPILFYDILKTRPVAFDHYVGYLTMKQNTNGLTDLSVIKGHNSVIGLKLYKILVKYFSNKETVDSLKKKLQTFHHHWFDYSSDENDGHIIKYYLDFLDWIKTGYNSNNVLNITVNNFLRIHCEKHWNLPENHLNSPHTLAKQQNVSNRQLHWILLDTKSAQQQWDDVLKFFIKTNWLGNKKVNNSLINVENIVIRIGEKNAPTAVLEKFLNMMDDTVKSVNLATKFKCHRHVIYVCEKEGDRQALEKYKNKIPAQSEDYFFAENSLRSIKIKWKN